MADIETTTVNEEKYFAVSRAGNYELKIDATGEDGPSPNEVLVADYASCFTFACRAGAYQELDIDLGKIETTASADINDDDDLSSISFEMHVEADLDDDEIDDVLELGNEICHVQAAILEELYADVTLHPNAL